MKISDHLVWVIHYTGTRHVFGIQGDYALNLSSELGRAPTASRCR